MGGKKSRKKRGMKEGAKVTPVGGDDASLSGRRCPPGQTDPGSLCLQPPPFLFAPPGHFLDSLSASRRTPGR